MRWSGEREHNFAARTAAVVCLGVKFPSLPFVRQIIRCNIIYSGSGSALLTAIPQATIGDRSASLQITVDEQEGPFSNDNFQTRSQEAERRCDPKGGGATSWPYPRHGLGRSEQFHRRPLHPRAYAKKNCRGGPRTKVSP